MYQDYDKNGNIVYGFVKSLRLIEHYLQSKKKNDLLLSYTWNFGIR